MTDSSLTWYVKTPAGVIGPVSPAQIPALIQTGTLTPESPVSRDGVVWCAAGQTFDFGPTRKPRVSASTALLIAVGVPFLMLALGCCGFLGLAFLLSDQPSTSVVPAANPNYEATWKYWHTLRSLLGQDMKTAEQIDSIAAQIETLAVTDVDADILQFALDLAGLLRRTAEVHRRQNRPDIMIEAFLRGLTGDPIGTVRDESQVTAQLREQWLQIQRQSTTLRVVLSRRYGVEFSSL